MKELQIIAISISSPVDPHTINRALQHLPAEKQTALRKFKLMNSMEHSLLGELCVRIEASKRLQRPAQQLTFRTNEYGKPFLLEEPDVHFNVTHSGQWVVCAFDSVEVGIDIEEINPISLDIAQRFFSRE
jgi:4'-phosphopantetheinyl transferase